MWQNWRETSMSVCMPTCLFVLLLITFRLVVGSQNTLRGISVSITRRSVLCLTVIAGSRRNCRMSFSQNRRGQSSLPGLPMRERSAGKFWMSKLNYKVPQRERDGRSENVSGNTNIFVSPFTGNVVTPLPSMRSQLPRSEDVTSVCVSLVCLLH